MVHQDNAFVVSGARDFLQVLPVLEITASSFFDPDAYSRFNAGKPGVDI